ncbi:MAG: hypothetical protein WA463_16220 [Terriglobales bacterium]
MRAANDVQDDEITPVQYARARRLTIGYVYALIWDGRLKARKVLGRWLIPANAVEERQRQIQLKQSFCGHGKQPK